MKADVKLKEVQCILKHLAKARGRISELNKKLVSLTDKREDNASELKEIKQDLQVQKNNIFSLYKNILYSVEKDFPFNSVMALCRAIRHLVSKHERTLKDYDFRYVIPLIDIKAELGSASDHADNIQGQKLAEKKYGEAGNE